MPAMIFFCEQCGEKYKFNVDLSVNTIFDKNNGAPSCPTEQCGRELSPVISHRIEGIRKEEKSNYDKMLDDVEKEKEAHKQFLEDNFCPICGPNYYCSCEEDPNEKWILDNQREG